MKVSELIEYLEKFEPDLPVFIEHLEGANDICLGINTPEQEKLIYVDKGYIDFHSVIYQTPDGKLQCFGLDDGITLENDNGHIVGVVLR